MNVNWSIPVFMMCVIVVCTFSAHKTLHKQGIYSVDSQFAWMEAFSVLILMLLTTMMF